MNISLDALKELRNLTSASVSDCKKALQEAEGDIKQAVKLLQKRGLEIAAKRKDRVSKEGRIESYIHHGNKIGVLLELGCDTDFVARNTDFAQFAKDIAMQIAANCPLYIKREDVPDEVIKQEKNKDEFYKLHCLMEQVFIKDPDLIIKNYLGSIVAKLGENITVRRFIRYKVGE